MTDKQLVPLNAKMAGGLRQQVRQCSDGTENILTPRLPVQNFRRSPKGAITKGGETETITETVTEQVTETVTVTSNETVTEQVTSTVIETVTVTELTVTETVTVSVTIEVVTVTVTVTPEP